MQALFNALAVVDGAVAVYPATDAVARSATEEHMHEHLCHGWCEFRDGVAGWCRANRPLGILSLLVMVDTAATAATRSARTAVHVFARVRDGSRKRLLAVQKEEFDVGKVGGPPHHLHGRQRSSHPQGPLETCLA
jgi:hypothetical protein